MTTSSCFLTKRKIENKAKDEPLFYDRRVSDVNALEKVNVLLNKKDETYEIVLEDHFNDSGNNGDEYIIQKPQQSFSSLINKEGNNNFGYVLAKFPDPNIWKKYYLKSDGPILYFYKSVKDNDYKVWYTIYKCQIEKVNQKVPGHNEEIEVFKITQKYNTK